MSISNLPRLRRLLLAIAALICLAAAPASADSPAILITGVQPNAVQLSLVDLKKLPTQRVRVVLENGTVAEYEGVAIGEVLAKAGLAMGTAIRGKRLADYLLVSARDGYRAIYALPELDAVFTDHAVLLCFARDGAPLPEEEGPFRLILPQEKRAARWMRQVERLAIKTEM